MGNRWRLWWQARVGLILAIVVGVLLPVSAMAAPLFDISRLDGDPLPVEVLAGRHNGEFSRVSGQSIFEMDQRPRWWRLTALRAVQPADTPYLVLRSPILNEVEVWRPGEAVPVRRSLMGSAADLSFSTRALVVPLPQGLATGESMYLRVHMSSPVPMPVSVEPLATVHRRDLQHVAVRTVVLSTLVVLALLAFGFWIGVGDRSYAYLFITLGAQTLYLASAGGELRVVPWLSDLLGSDPRTARMFGLLAVIASNSFMSFYLNMPQRQPRLMWVIQVCNGVLLLLLLLTIGSTAAFIALVANVTLVISALAMFVGSIGSALQRQREGYFMLMSWSPMAVLVVMRVGELLGLWRNPEWMEYAFPIGFAMGGLVLSIGLTDHLHQLRRDRDHASHLATYDLLTGALTRSAIEERLAMLVESAHKTRRPLSVVFFDIDHFKRINDEHGHRIGDQTLRIVALRTRNRLRTYDLVGRYGGDEILVVLPDTYLREALGVAENLRDSVNCRPLSIEGRLFSASLSLGVAELHYGETPERLLERADAALYVSKSGGRDRVTGHTTSRLSETAT